MMDIKTTLPLISIGIPTYNGSKRLPRALTSIWAQQYPNLEIIISDNCSTDNTQETVVQVQQDHPEVKYFRQSKNIGILSNFEFTIAHATGKYFMWVSDDDAVETGAFFKYVTFLETNPQYALVSGHIKYWQGDTLDYIERGLSFESNYPGLRTIQYYFSVIYGGMFHGLMRMDMAAVVPTRKVFANDFHFVASLAYVGKIKNFEYTGYHKYLGGFSQDIKKSATALGESDLASEFPYVKLSIDAFAEILFRSPVYYRLPALARFPLAVLCFLSAFFGYYGKIYPLTVAGKLKRFAFRILGIRDKGSLFKRRSQRVLLNKL